MQVLIACFGSNNYHFLAANLESIAVASGDQWQVTVLTDSSTNPYLEAIKLRYSEVVFVSTHNDYESKACIDAAIKPSMKLKYWSEFLGNCTTGNHVLFLDVDTIVRYKFAAADVCAESDLCYTIDSNSKWPLNVGVIICKVSQQVITLFNLWYQEVHNMLQDIGAVETASKKAGAVDQYVLLRFLTDNFRHSIHLGESSIKIEPSISIKTLGLPATTFNCTKSSSVDPTNYILHYKGGWKNIINNDGRFTKLRNAKESYCMYSIWQDTYLNSCLSVASSYVTHSADALIENNAGLVTKLSQEDYQDRGILNSEIFLILSLGSLLKVNSVIESGRARGHSTYLLANYLNEGDCLVESVDLVRDSDAIYAESKLHSFANVNCYYGDAFELIPRLCDLQVKPYFLLIDGPKGSQAFELARQSLKCKNPPQLIFIHDLKDKSSGKASLSRFLIDKYFDCVFFSDSNLNISKTKNIDKSSFHDPYKKDSWSQGSYGPTLAVIIPTFKDLVRAKNKNILKGIQDELFRPPSIIKRFKDASYRLRLKITTKSF